MYLFGIDIEDFCGICWSNSYKSTWVHLARSNSFLPNDRHPILNSINTIGNLSKIIFTKSFLWTGESTVICTSSLKIAAAKYKIKLLNFCFLLSLFDIFVSKNQKKIEILLDLWNIDWYIETYSANWYKYNWFYNAIILLCFELQIFFI